MRKTLFASALILAFMAGSVTAYAQEGQPDPKAMEEMMMKLMMPGAPHQHLADGAGKWTATLTMYTPGTEPTTSAGTLEAEMVLGGRYLVSHFHSTYMGQPFQGMSIDGYDNGTQKFFNIWFDEMGTGYFLSEGTASADGKVYTYTGTMNMGPMAIPTRSEYTYPDKDTIKFVMWQSMGGQEAKSMEVVYKRAK